MPTILFLSVLRSEKYLPDLEGTHLNPLVVTVQPLLALADLGIALAHLEDEVALLVLQLFEVDDLLDRQQGSMLDPPLLGLELLEEELILLFFFFELFI